MFCVKCGNEVPEGSAFCPKCGTRVETATGSEDTVSKAVDAVKGFVNEQTDTTPKGNDMNIWQYFVKSLKNYAKFDGRARRKEYWSFQLFYILFSMALAPTVVGSVIFAVAFLVPWMAVSFRRMHDVGKPGGFYFIPTCGFILALCKGQAWENKYGADPLAK